MSTTGSDRSNLDDASAHYGLDHGSTLKTPEQRRLEYAQRTGTPIDDKMRLTVRTPDTSTDLDPELVGKSPEEVAAILAERTSHREGCDNPKCSRCAAVDDRMLRGNHVTTGGGSGGGRRRRKAGGRRSAEAAMAHVYEDEIERDRRPIVVSGRVSVEANAGLCGRDVPGAGEILNVVGLTLHRGVSWENIAAALARLA